MNAELLFPPQIDHASCWLLAINKVRIGIHPQEHWCIDVAGKMMSLKSTDDMMPLLPILDVGRRPFFEHLDRVAKWCPELEAWVNAFPEELLLKFALERSVSDYWPSKALDWACAEPALKATLRESLKVVLTQRWLSQRFRQRVELVYRSVR